jgi:2-polyprenyl-6-methoxyphenol hydroxylase-like FAD-dependent oxidoreductase
MALVAGGGIGGLATAIALRRAGHDVEVFERSSELSEVGAGLMIWPNGTRALQSLGVEVNALKVSRILLSSWRGRAILDYPLDTITERYGSDVAFVHRRDLKAGLAALFGVEGLHLAAQVVDFEQDETEVRIRLADGAVVRGDVLVGADGLRSAVRSRLLGDGDPTYLGSTVWRGVVKSDGLALPAGHGINWFGCGAEFLAFHIPDAQVYWGAVTKEPRGEKPGPRGHKEDLLRRFGDWPEIVRAVIEATDSGAILRNDMYDRPPVKHWSAGRVTLVGDAAHPMTPNQGQGACQALEDAVALGASLKGTTGVAEAFALYERRRLRRANRAVTMSRQATRGVQIENPMLCAMRDRFIGLLPLRLVLRTLDGTLGAPVA